MAVEQPIGLRVVDYLKKLPLEITGIDAGRQVAGDHKIVDIKAGKARIDLKGAGAFLAHNIAPIEVRVAQHPKLGEGDLPALAWGADVFVTGATALTAVALKEDIAAAIGVFAGLNTAKNAAIVLIPDVAIALRNGVEKAGNKIAPYFQRRPEISGNGT